jgi:hypothetical protein
VVEEIRTQKPVPRWLIIAALVLAALSVAGSIFWGVHGGLFWLGYLTYASAQWARGATRVAADGVHLGALRPSGRLIPWDQVDAVQQPSRFDESVTLLLADDRVLALPGIGADRAQDVATIGGKELRAGARPFGNAPGKTSESRRPTEAEIERDLSARSAVLSAESTRLTSELSRIKKSDDRPS